MEASTFFLPLKRYLDAFAEQDAARRLVLLEQCLTSNAEIWGAKRVFTGYVEISGKIEGFHRGWPNCRLVLASELVCFKTVGHFAIAIISSEDSVLASGHSVVELAIDDSRFSRVLAFWGPSISRLDVLL